MILWQQYSSDPWKSSYDNHYGLKNYEIFKTLHLLLEYILVVKSLKPGLRK